MAVRIPVYDQRTTPSTGGIQARAQGGVVSDATARALGNVAQAGGQYADILLKKEADDAVSDAGKKVSDATVHWSGYLQEKSSNAAPGAPNFTGEFVSEFDKYSEQTLAGITHPVARKVAARNMLALRESLQLRAMSFEAQAGVAKRASDLDDSVRNYSSIVAADPSQAAFARQAVLDQIANGGFGEKAPQMAAQAKQALTAAMWTGLVQRDPKGAKAALEATLGISMPEMIIGSTAPTVESVWPKLERSESGGKQSAVSPKGAVGVAQIMPSTGPEAAQLAGLPWDETKFRTDAAYNRALGQAYLAKQLDTFGSMDKALAAYNAGPGRLRDALKAGEAGWLDRMPEETRNYVRGILGAPGAKEAPAASQRAPASPQYVEWAKGLSVQQVSSFLTAAESEINRQQAGARAGLEARVSSHVAGTQNGVVPQQPVTEAEFVAALGPEQGQLRFRAYEQQLRTGADIAALRTMPPDKARQLIERAAPPANSDDPLYAGAVQRQAQLVEAYQRVRTAQTTDPMAYAIETKIGGAPMNFSDTKAMSEELVRRVGLAKTMRDTYATGQELRLLTKGEADALGTLFNGYAVSDQKNLLQILRASVSDDEAFGAVLQQIRPNSPATAVAGEMMVMNDPKRVQGFWWWQDDREYKPTDAAGIILEGERLLNPTKVDKADAGKGSTFPMPSDNELRAAFTDAVGTAFGQNFDGANAAYQAFRSYYAGRAARDGDFSGEYNNAAKSRVKEALMAVLPGVSNVNGKGDVFRPYGMSEDVFEATLLNKYGEFMQEQKLAGSEIDNFNAWRVVRLSGNRYVLKAGDLLRYVSGPMKGQPFVADFAVAPGSISGRIDRAPAMAPPMPGSPSTVRVAK